MAWKKGGDLIRPVHLRSVVRKVMSTGAFARILLGVDAGLARVAALLGLRSSETWDVCVVSAPGDGNIGDQALLESCLDHVPQKRVVIVTSAERLELPVRFAGVRVVKSRPLLYSVVLAHWIAVLRFVHMVRSCGEVWVVGADTMDGAYNPTASVLRYSVSNIAAMSGCETRILGFSWNTTPTMGSITAARYVEGKCQLWVRDPMSLRRIRSNGVLRVKQCADIVFSRRGGQPAFHPVFEWVQDRKDAGERVAVVNASGLIAGSIDQALEYGVIVEALIRDGWNIVFLPHVMRPGNDDLAELQKIRVDCREGQIYRVEGLLEPDQVARLASMADIAVTGRMHLAILSILGSTYPVMLATQGKVEGLCEYLGRPELGVEPNHGFGLRVLDVLKGLDASNALARGVDSADVDRLRELASIAFL